MLAAETRSPRRYDTRQQLLCSRRANPTQHGGTKKGKRGCKQLVTSSQQEHKKIKKEKKPMNKAIPTDIMTANR